MNERDSEEFRAIYTVAASKIDYNSETGKAIWKMKPETSQRNIAWNIKFGLKEIKSKINGYICVSIWHNKKRMQLYLHRICWFIVYNELAPNLVDHINRNRSDNRISNLRLANHCENQRNTSKLRNNTSGVTGVSWDKDRNKWRANCGFNGKSHYLGLYSDIIEAEKVVRKFRSENGFTDDHGS